MNLNYQQIQHALDILLIGLPSALFALVALDLIERLIRLWHSCSAKQSATTSSFATAYDTVTITSTPAEVWDEAFASLPDLREDLNASKKEIHCVKTEYEPAIDFTALSLRQCRAIIKEINKGLPSSERIRQKVNRKDAPVAWLRAQIEKRLAQEPIDTSQVISSVLKAS